MTETYYSISCQMIVNLGSRLENLTKEERLLHAVLCRSVSAAAELMEQINRATIEENNQKSIKSPESD